jgi:hypothetical protein
VEIIVIPTISRKCEKRSQQHLEAIIRTLAWIFAHTITSLGFWGFGESFSCRSYWRIFVSFELDQVFYLSFIQS